MASPHVWLPTAGAAAAGGISVVYSAAMAAIGRGIGSPLWSVPLAYAQSLPVLLICELLRPQPAPVTAWEGVRRVFKHIAKKPHKRWVMLTGGVLGSLIGVTAAYVTPRIGMGLFFVLFVAGQVLAAHLMDLLQALLASDEHSMSSSLGGSLLVLSGCILYQREALQTVHSSLDIKEIICCSMACLGAGLCAVLQGGVNGRLQDVSTSHNRTAIWSLTSGLLVISALAYLFDPVPHFESFFLSLHWPQDAWRALGGILSINTLVAIMVLPKYLGYALTVCWMVAGELVVSLALDHYGWLDMQKRPVSKVRMGGLVVVLAGVILAQQANRSRQRRKSSSWSTRPVVNDQLEQEYNIASSLETNCPQCAGGLKEPFIQPSSG